MLRLLAAAIVVGTTGCGAEGGGLPVEPITQPGDYARTVEVNGLLRAYSVHVPASVDPSSPSPLLLVFHGVPRTDMRVLTGLDDVADAMRFVVVFVEAYPAFGDWDVGCGDCTAAGSRGAGDVGYVRALIEKLRGDIAIDAGRVFVAGFSQGALFAHRLACEASGRIAGAISVAATMLASVAQRCTPSSALSMVFIHGDSDPEFPRGGRQEGDVSTLSIDATVQRWVALEGCTATLTVAMLPDTADDGTTVERRQYSACASGGRVTFYDVHGGGHTWPGAPVEFSTDLGTKSRDLNASVTIGRLVTGN
jgi:polyhydroxybutyrate depolymerase